jgi:hypothetical protein
MNTYCRWFFHIFVSLYFYKTLQAVEYKNWNSTPGEYKTIFKKEFECEGQIYTNNKQHGEQPEKINVCSPIFIGLDTFLEKRKRT